MHFSLRAGVFMSSGSTEERGKEEGGRNSVEEDGLGVSVGNLRHVFEYVLFGDDSQQPPIMCNQTLS